MKKRMESERERDRDKHVWNVQTEHFLWSMFVCMCAGVSVWQFNYTRRIA